MADKVKGYKLTCKFCGNTLVTTLVSYRENPYCGLCYEERVVEAAARIGLGEMQLQDDGYFRFVPVK